VLGEDDGDELQVAVVPPSGTRESVLTIPRHRLTWLAPARRPTSHYWAIPGYFDAHRHLPPEGSSALSARMAVSTARIRAIEDAARDGIWGIRDMGVAMLAPWPVRSGLVATAIRGVAGVNCDFARPFAVAGQDPRQIRRLVNENHDAGAHFIKIFTNGSGYLRQSEALEMTMTAEAIRAAVDIARARGMSVAAHCHGGDAFAACLDAKVGSIEDLTELRLDGARLAAVTGGRSDKVSVAGQRRDVLGWSEPQTKGSEMATTSGSSPRIRTGSIPQTDLPFSIQEYERRVAAVVKRFEAVKIDALAATSDTSQEYLTGYDGSADYFAPFPVIVTPTRPPTYVVRKYDEDAVRTQSWIKDVIPYTQETEQAKVWADALRSLGLQRARLGLELRTWNLAPADVSALQTELPDLQIIDATHLVPSVAAVKSEVELETMRASMALTDIAIDTFQRSINEGSSEREVADAIERAITAAGGENRSFTLVFGQRTALPHGRPTANRISHDEPAFTEVAGMKNGYAAGLCRSAVLGHHAGAEMLHELAEEALAAAIAAIRPGVPTGGVDAAARAVIERAGKSRVFRHRTGYQNGIAWSYRGNLSLEPGSTDVIEVGMTFHIPIILFEEGEFGIGTSQSIVVSERGAEVLSRTSSGIHRIS
jgi:Xaa-Pro aminopeptidase